MVGGTGEGVGIEITSFEFEHHYLLFGASLVAQLVKKKKAACNAEDPGSIPGSGSSPEEGIGHPLQYPWASLVTQTIKNSPGMWETWVRSLGWEDPLEEGMATHSSILSWRIPWTEEPGGLQSMGSQKTDQLRTWTYLLFRDHLNLLPLTPAFYGN